ncbi:MAG: hypothetical protein NTY12_03140 [Candidatus Falkowbacteria bacterium]|nr:hypothetical protein [Candidatus Falkowbacteria bacterium]
MEIVKLINLNGAKDTLTRLFNFAAKKALEELKKAMKDLIDKKLVTINMCGAADYCEDLYIFSVSSLRTGKSIYIHIKDNGKLDLVYEFRGGKERMCHAIDTIDKKFLNPRMKVVCKYDLELESFWATELEAVKDYFTSRRIPVKKHHKDSFTTKMSSFKVSEKLDQQLKIFTEGGKKWFYVKLFMNRGVNLWEYFHHYVTDKEILKIVSSPGYKSDRKKDGIEIFELGDGREKNRKDLLKKVFEK